MESKLKKRVKIFLSITAVAIIAATSLIYYFFEYKNHRIGYLFMLSLLAGGMVLLYTLAGKYVMASKISWKEDRAGALKQGFTNLFCYITMVTLMFALGWWVMTGEEAREHDIMTNQPTAYTHAYVGYVTVTRGKNGPYYDAEIQYVVNGKFIYHEIPDNSGYLKAGQTYLLKYSIRYPEMFEICGN